MVPDADVGAAAAVVGAVVAGAAAVGAGAEVGAVVAGTDVGGGALVGVAAGAHANKNKAKRAIKNRKPYRFIFLLLWVLDGCTPHNRRIEMASEAWTED